MIFFDMTSTHPCDQGDPSHYCCISDYAYTVEIAANDEIQDWDETDFSSGICPVKSASLRWVVTLGLIVLHLSEGTTNA